MLNNIILITLFVCFLWAVAYMYLYIKEALSHEKSKKQDKVQFEMSAEEVLMKFNELVLNGETDAAQKLAKRYLSFDAEHHELRKKLADLYIEINKEYEAITHLSVLTHIYPDDIILFQNLAKLYKKTHQTKKAIHFYSYVLEKNKDDISAMKNLADLYYQNKQKESALKLYKQLVFATDDENEKMHYNEVMGSIYSSYGDFDKAIGLYEKVLKIDDKKIDIIRDLRRIYMKLKDTQKVIEYSQRLIELDAQNYIYYIDLINLYFHLKEYNSALFYAEKALNLRDANIEELQNIIAKIYIYTGKIQEGIELINRALEQNPTSIALSQTLAMGYCKANDFEMAKKVCLDAIEIAVPSEVKGIRNNISTILSEEAMYLLNQGDSKEGFEKFSEAIKYNSENPEIYFKLSNANLLIKNYPEAIRQCKRAIDLSPQTGQYYEKLADIYYELENYFDAKKAYKDTVSIDPKNARAHTFLGIIQAKDKENEAAVKSLETAVSLDPTNPDIIYNLGLAYEYAGRREEAIERYQQVLTIDPNHKEAANNLKLL